MNMQKQSAGKEKLPKGAKDIYAMRKRKKRRKVLQQSIWMLLLAVTVLVLYQRRDSWIPKLETMGMRHQNQRLGANVNRTAISRSACSEIRIIRPVRQTESCCC